MISPMGLYTASITFIIIKKKSMSPYVIPLGCGEPNGYYMGSIDIIINVMGRV